MDLTTLQARMEFRHVAGSEVAQRVRQRVRSGRSKYEDRPRCTRQNLAHCDFLRNLRPVRNDGPLSGML